MWPLFVACVGLFPGPLAPPAPSRLLSQVAEFILRARLRECGSCDIEASADAASILAGGVKSVRIKGQRWCTPMRLSCRELDIAVGATSVDFPALASRRILLKKPALGDATISFTAADWDNFLVHPQMDVALAERRKRALESPTAQ